MKTTLVLTLALWSSAQAFQVRSSSSTSKTALDAAISPRRGTYVVPKKITTKQQPLKVKPGEVVLDPYYGIPNGILGAAPAILFMYAGRYNCVTQSEPFFRNVKPQKKEKQE